VLFCIGLTLETVADIQLRRFLRDPAHHNQVMQRTVAVFAPSELLR
jgi:steroid 5-alpha reductase family enzyme